MHLLKDVHSRTCEQECVRISVHKVSVCVCARMLEIEGARDMYVHKE